MKSLRGRIIYGTTSGNSQGIYVLFVPVAKGNNGETVQGIVDLNPESPTFGAKVSVGDVVPVIKHTKWAKGVLVTITEIRFDCSHVFIEGRVPGQEDKDGFSLSQLSFPKII